MEATMSRRRRELAQYAASLAVWACWVFCGLLAAEAVALNIVRRL